MNRSKAPAGAFRLALLSSAMISLSALPAIAQETAAQPAIIDDTESVAEPAIEEERRFTEIVVTAERREARLQDVPASVTALSADSLEISGIGSTKELTQVTPGLYFTQSSYSPQPTIRGIGTRGVSAGDESVVPVYIDGVYQPVLSSTVMNFNNIQRVEVLRGPQGALLGRNATGGAINVITKTPSLDPAAKFSASYGSYNEVTGQAYVTGGVAGVAADLAIYASKDDGYIRNIAKNEDQGALDTISLRSKVLFDLADNFQVTLAVGHINTIDSTPYATHPVDGNTVALRFDPNTLLPNGSYETSALDAGALKTRQNSGSVSAVWNGPGFDLHSITGVQYNSLSARADSDGTPVIVGQQDYINYGRSIVEDLYLISTSDGPFSWIAGVTLYDDYAGGKGTNQVIRSLATGNLSLVSSTGRVETQSIAAYLQGSYEFTDQWKLTAGGRFTHDEKDFFIRNNVSGAFLKAEKTWEKFTPTATLQYQPNPDLNIYAKAGQAFKAGIFPSTTFSATPVNPETVTQYELGIKSSPADWMRLNLAAYYTDYENVQVSLRDPVTLVSTLENAASAEISGIEAELIASPVDGLNIRSGLSLQDATYVEYRNASATFPTGLGGASSATIDASGNKLIRTPEYTINFGFDYTLPAWDGDFTWSGNIYHSGESFRDAANSVRDDPYTVVNTEISWLDPSEKYRVALFSENLFDEDYSLFVLPSTTAYSRVAARPQTFGVRLSASFD